MRLLRLEKDQLTLALEEPRGEIAFADWRADPASGEGVEAVVVPNDASAEDLVAAADAFGALILEFPAFKDGRAYSQARLLRDRLGFTGEIRARGDVLRDQLFFMARCGFTAFEFAGENAEDALEAAKEFSFAYQSAADGVRPVWRARLDRAAAA